MAGKAVEDTERYCRRCEQRVPPVVRKPGGEYAGYLAVTQVGAVVVAVALLFHQVRFLRLLSHVYIPRLTGFVIWPLFVKPTWFGLAGALAALAMSAIVWFRAPVRAQRAQREATCPICLLPFDAE
ncbi:hypothetical protein ABZ883_32480 [Streptomyces sp. NPDC046977]|uniref:hypothetical protein n=1 Tax=Streptomyces sp. NPDC046977 TaxID=3154703 RepID=UPI0033E66567